MYTPVPASPHNPHARSNGLFCNTITLQTCHEVAAQHKWNGVHGLCLSTEYKSNKTKMLWQCEYRHKPWPAKLNKIKDAGRWCPVCAGSKGELFTRLILEYLLGCSLSSGRPDWLISPDGYNMNYDGYSPERMIAFEHDGPQHYRQVKNRKSLESIQKLDEEKRKLSKDRVTLLTIKEIPESAILSDWITEVVAIVDASGLQIVGSRDPSKIENAVSMPDCDDFIKLRKIVSQHPGAKVLSKNFIGPRVKLRIDCGCGHVWEVIPRTVFSGSWCRECWYKQVAEMREANSSLSKLQLK